MDMIYVCAASAMLKVGEVVPAKQFLWKAYFHCADMETRCEILGVLSDLTNRRKHANDN